MDQREGRRYLHDPKCDSHHHFLEGCKRGLIGTPGKRVCFKRAPRVRIPLPPLILVWRNGRRRWLISIRLGVRVPSPVLLPDVDEWFSHLADIQGSQKRRRFESCRQDKMEEYPSGKGGSLLNC